MKTKTGYFKRNFAKFLAQLDQESYEVHQFRKTELFNEVNGSVLEIGPGTGVNFPFLKDKNIKWLGLEPNPAMYPYLMENAQQHGISVELIEGSTEAIRLSDNAVDYVISTEVLCSVKDLRESLSEIWRVLKPNGKFLFLEHVIDKKNVWRQSVQRIVPYTPWRFYSDGCHPARDIGKAIQEAGFSDVQYVDYLREGEGLIITINRPHIYGWAVK